MIGNEQIIALNKLLDKKDKLDDFEEKLESFQRTLQVILTDSKQLVFLDEGLLIPMKYFSLEAQVTIIEELLKITKVSKNNIQRIFDNSTLNIYKK